jgi:CheY-like chemotaxis protein
VIVIVDRENSGHGVLTKYLGALGYEVQRVSTADAAFHRLKDCKFGRFALAIINVELDSDGSAKTVAGARRFVRGRGTVGLDLLDALCSVNSVCFPLKASVILGANARGIVAETIGRTSERGVPVWRLGNAGAELARQVDQHIKGLVGG